MMDSFKVSNNSSKVIGVVVCLAIAAYSGNRVLNSNNSTFTSPTEQHPVASPLQEADTTGNVFNATTSAKPADASKQLATTDVLDYKSWSEERGYISGQHMAVLVPLPQLVIWLCLLSQVVLWK